MVLLSGPRQKPQDRDSTFQGRGFVSGQPCPVPHGGGAGQHQVATLLLVEWGTPAGDSSCTMLVRNGDGGNGKAWIIPCTKPGGGMALLFRGWTHWVCY